MMEHLTSEMLNLFADGELSHDQIVGVNEHLSMCKECTASVLSQMVLKSTAARAGQRYTMPAGLRERLLHDAATKIQMNEPMQSSAEAIEIRKARKIGTWGWASAAAMLLLCASIVFFQRGATSRTSEAALITEVSDQHIATLASNQEPQVLSSDRHTVKPWFQGKIPFSFNLPEGLPEDTKLDGANLAYLHNQPVAQLLYSIGKHRVSVFVRERNGTHELSGDIVEHAGFQIARGNTSELEFVAVSDVEPRRLNDLIMAMAQAQMKR
jgi:anti-sigma factor RsiW